MILSKTQHQQKTPLAKYVAKSSNLRGGDNAAEYTRMLPDTLDKIKADFFNQIKENEDFRQWILIK